MNKKKTGNNIMRAKKIIINGFTSSIVYKIRGLNDLAITTYKFISISACF